MSLYTFHITTRNTSLRNNFQFHGVNLITLVNNSMEWFFPSPISPGSPPPLTTSPLPPLLSLPNSPSPPLLLPPPLLNSTSLLPFPFHSSPPPLLSALPPPSLHSTSLLPSPFTYLHLPSSPSSLLLYFPPLP